VAAYIDKQDYVKRLGEIEVVKLSDLNNTGEADDERLNAAATAASSMFDSYVLARYPAPITATPLVKKLVLDIAIYQLASSLLETDEGRYKIYLDQYKAAIQFLTAVAAGKAQLDQTTGVVDAAYSGDVPFIIVEDDPPTCLGVTQWQRL
jgi:phage gp36-like protein